MPKIMTHRDLEVFQKAFDVSMTIFRFSKKFPKEETYSLIDQIRRSSRSVATNLAEAWRKRRYEAAFIAKLNDCEAEAAETQVWIEYAVACEYLNKEDAKPLYRTYNSILATLVGMINHSESWVLPGKPKT